MKRRKRRRMGPLLQQRFAMLLILYSAGLAGLGAYSRATDGFGASSAGGYLLETTGLLLAAGAAAWQARVAEMLIVFDSKAVRRRAILSLLAGMCTALIGCVAASTVETNRYEAYLPAIAQAGTVGGLGLGLAGFFSLAWVFGMGYVGSRIERSSEEDW